jgi:thioredoxin-like negative regulator of GroEL
MRHVSRQQINGAWKLAGAIFVILITAIFILHYRLIDGYEVFSIRYFPNAERAYQYGSEHFSESKPNEYNPTKAEEFFKVAAQLDPKYPYVNHQLARLEFLQGHYNSALAYINTQIEIFGTSTPNSYYVRGLIEGYKEDYLASIKDYKIYIAADPTNWAATNDLAWVFLKANKPKDALEAINKVLPYWPENPWLLNSKATALYELGRLEEAHTAAAAAMQAVSKLRPKDWSYAYPGNDPLIGDIGLAQFQKAVIDNMHTIELALQKRQANVQ